jgi:hypothetical protein
MSKKYGWKLFESPLDLQTDYPMNAIGDIGDFIFLLHFIVVSPHIDAYDDFPGVMQVASETGNLCSREALETYVDGIWTTGS